MSKRICIDLGSKNTVIAEQNSGVILSEPTLAAIDLKTKQLIAVGDEVEKLLGRTPKDISVISPVAGGVIADFDVASVMLKTFVEKIFPKGILRPRATVCIPYGITDVEEKVLIECVSRANLKCDFTFESPIASLIGSDKDVEEPAGNMILDIGGGKMCASCVSFGGIVAAFSRSGGGDKMDSLIADFIKKNYGVKIGKKTAEEIKIRVGSCFGGNESFSVVGRDEVSGLPKEVSVTSDDVLCAISGELNEIINIIKKTLENTPAELIYDITNNGICLTGGGSQLSGLEDFVEEKIGICAQISKNPTECAALGACAFLPKVKVR